MTSATPKIPKYTDDFFTSHEEAVFRSARVIVLLVLNYVRPKTVVDIGCGRGEWLSVFQEHGVSIQGIDGPYIEPNRLFIRGDRFRACDLTGPFRIDGRYDLACCLEVAEHLPEGAACLPATRNRSRRTFPLAGTTAPTAVGLIDPLAGQPTILVRRRSAAPLYP